MKKLLAMLICAMAMTSVAYAATPNVGDEGYARVTYFQFKPGVAGKVIEDLQNNIMPASRKQPGYRAWYTLMSGDAGVNITIWDSQEAMTQSETSGSYRDQIAKLSDMFVGKPTPPARRSFRQAHA